MSERRVGRGGVGGGKRDLKVRDWEEREWIGARGEMMYIPRLLSGGIGRAMSRSINSRAILSTTDNGSFCSRESLLKLQPD